MLVNRQVPDMAAMHAYRSQPSVLSVAIDQIQLPPNYGEAWKKQKAAAAKPKKTKSPNSAARQLRLMEVCREIGESTVAQIMAVHSPNDPTLHKDDARKMMDLLCKAGAMSKRRVRVDGRSRTVYSVPSNAGGNAT